MQRRVFFRALFVLDQRTLTPSKTVAKVLGHAGHRGELAEHAKGAIQDCLSPVDTAPDTPPLPVPPWHKQLLDERRKAVEEGREEVVDWDAIKDSLGSRGKS